MEALKMKDGKEVWDINELRKNFDFTGSTVRVHVRDK